MGTKKWLFLWSWLQNEISRLFSKSKNRKKKDRSIGWISRHPRYHNKNSVTLSIRFFFFIRFFLILFFSHLVLVLIIFSFLVNSLSRNRNFRNKIQNHGYTLAHVCNTVIHILSRIHVLPIKSAIRSQILLSLRLLCVYVCIFAFLIHIRPCRVQNVTPSSPFSPLLTISLFLS